VRADRIAATVLLTVACGCSIEPTPREYIDRRQPTEDVQAEAREAVESRLRLLVHSLSRGDPTRARAALSPAPDVRVYGPSPTDQFDGEAQLRALLDLAAGATRGALRLRDLEVNVGSRSTVAWFAALAEVGDPARDPVPVRVTGVFRFREGEWELAQAHVRTPESIATAPYPPGQPAPAADE
jgi:hypothetical protein